MEEEKIKNIVSTYTRVPVDTINAQTLVDRSALASSILLHRMYAAFATEGIVVDNYWDIKTYGALLQRLSDRIEQPVSGFSEPVPIYNNDYQHDKSSASAGIDIEEIQSMPQVDDFREDEFYTMNFSSSEIAYCILQPNSLASFAGLFAAKEAIVKADNSYINRPFNTIIINHLPGGKPEHPSFQISISHTSTVAVGIAIKAASFPTGQNVQLTPSSVLTSNKNISAHYAGRKF